MEEQVHFKAAEDFRIWLTENDQRTAGLWLLFGKCGKLASLTAEEALDEALCFGWIDGLIKGIDDTCYKKYFAPRRKGSP
jgi:uncharacterized protein YdeI (YjbR/CyaY-like superfamily)